MNTKQASIFSILALMPKRARSPKKWALTTLLALAVATISASPALARDRHPDPTPTPCPPILPAGATTTTLLFPFVTNQAGFDTAITISNTSADTVGTTHQAGTCTITYFGNTTGGGAAPAAQTSPSVPAGQQLIFTLSSGGGGVSAAPGFQGYIMVTCNFQFAHGFAFVSDLGARNLATGYLALVVPAGGRNTCGESLLQ